jgi:hypothetical protein
MSYASAATRSSSKLLARLGAVAAAILLPALPSCALLVNGMTQTVQVTSTPAGAAVFVDGEPHGTTPVAIELRRDRTSVVVVRLGSQERSTLVTGRANGSLIALDAAPAAVLAAGTVATCTSAGGEWVVQIFCAYLAAGTLIATAPVLIDGGTGAWNELSPAEIDVVFD